MGCRTFPRKPLKAKVKPDGRTDVGAVDSRPCYLSEADAGEEVMSSSAIFVIGVVSVALLAIFVYETIRGISRAGIETARLVLLCQIHDFWRESMSDHF
jgi:hypothetical protein